MLSHAINWYDKSFVINVSADKFNFPAIREAECVLMQDIVKKLENVSRKSSLSPFIRKIYLIYIFKY